MDSRGSRLLRQSRNVFLNVASDGQHEIGEFIDNDHDSRQSFVN
jgi:hypothetical protein